MDEETYDFVLDCSLPNRPNYLPWRRFSDDPPFYNSIVLAAGKKRTAVNERANWWIGLREEILLKSSVYEDDEIWWVYPPAEIERLGDIAKYG